jgi:hypothetical protein
MPTSSAAKAFAMPRVFRRGALPMPILEGAFLLALVAVSAL